MTTRLNWVDWVAMVLLVIGGLNWGLIGLFGFDLVAAIFAPVPVLAQATYILVGLAALWGIYTLYKLYQGRAGMMRPEERRKVA